MSEVARQNNCDSVDLEEVCVKTKDDNVKEVDNIDTGVSDLITSKNQEVDLNKQQLIEHEDDKLIENDTNLESNKKEDNEKLIENYKNLGSNKAEDDKKIIENDTNLGSNKKEVDNKIIENDTNLGSNKIEDDKMLIENDTNLASKKKEDNKSDDNKILKNRVMDTKQTELSGINYNHEVLQNVELTENNFDASNFTQAHSAYRDSKKKLIEINLTPNNNQQLSDNTDSDSSNQKSETESDSEHEKELSELKTRHAKQIEDYEDKIKLLEWNLLKSQKQQKEMEAKVDSAVKEKECAVKEKESMVMRYAVREKNLIKQQSACEHLEKKLKDTSRELDLLQHKLTSMTSDKSRICQLLDNKCYEMKTTQQELDRLKSDLNSLETKLKWSQNSLKTEMELRKEAESKVETLNSQIQEYVDAAEKAKKDAAGAVKEFYTSQDNRAHVLDQQLKELQASLIMLKHERDDREQQGKALQSEMERLQRKQSETLQENNMLSMKVQQLEKERSEQELKLSELRDCADQQRQDAVDLHHKTSLLEQMKLQLKNEQEQVFAMNEQISALKQRNADLLSDMESCRIHEAELLSFTHQLTDKNVRLQSEFTAMETRVQQLTCEQAVLKRAAKEQETKAALVSSQLMEMKTRKNDESEKVLKELEEKTGLCEKLAQEVADQKGEYSVMKRKLELSLREANKELVQCRKKLEQYERGEGTTSSSSSSTSLNTVEQRSNQSPVSTPDQVQVVQPERELDRQALIEHIVKLQRASARKSEKLDFLEEHVNTLVAELQKKSRLLQSYILREQAGTLSSNTMDNNKANLAKYSGVMASMYGSKVVDGNLTLELSLDINRKLQAVLEDALLKNITLKENVDTLGAEIDRLLKKPSPAE